jgi:hypothetical protein
MKMTGVTTGEGEGRGRLDRNEVRTIPKLNN